MAKKEPEKKPDVKAEETRLSPAEERVKAYLEGQIKDDAALAALYAPSRIKDCFQYITAEAKKKAQGGSYFAEDSEVWKWARDYFIEELPKKAEKMPPEVAEKKAQGGSYFAEDSEVWKWARDNFIEELSKKAAQMPPEVAEKKAAGEAVAETAETAAETEPVATMDNTAPKATEQTDENAGTLCEEAAAIPDEAGTGGEDTPEDDGAEDDGAQTDEYGFEVYGGKEDSGAETEPGATMDNTAPEAPVQTDENPDEPPAYDDEGNGLLFGL